MKKYLFLGAVVLLLTGCIEMNIGDVSVTQKDGVLCFDIEDEVMVRSDRVSINSIMVYEVGTQPAKILMHKDFFEKPLRPGKCIPYEGVPFENNILYRVYLGVFIKYQRKNVINSYNRVFCFSEKNNSEKVFHSFKESERPESCPVSSDE